MKLFEKPAFRWKEPKAFIQAKEAREKAHGRWWHKQALACVYVLMLLVPWALAKLNPAKDPLSYEVAILIAVGGGLVFAYGLPWLATVIDTPSEVRMARRCLLRQHVGSLLLDYSKMRCFDWVSGPEYHVLMLKYGPKEGLVSLGVPNDMDTGAMSAFLLSKGVPRATTTAV